MAAETKTRHLDEDRLSMISRMSQAVVDVPKKDIQMVKSFNNPPEAVKDVLDATLVLLGYDKQDVNWKQAKLLLGKFGEEALQKRVAAIDPESITPEQRKKASEILSSYSKERIAKVSLAALTLFQWANAVSED